MYTYQVILSQMEVHQTPILRQKEERMPRLAVPLRFGLVLFVFGEELGGCLVLLDSVPFLSFLFHSFHFTSPHLPLCVRRRVRGVVDLFDFVPFLSFLFHSFHFTSLTPGRTFSLKELRSFPPGLYLPTTNTLPSTLLARDIPNSLEPFHTTCVK